MIFDLLWVLAVLAGCACLALGVRAERRQTVIPPAPDEEPTDAPNRP